MTTATALKITPGATKLMKKYEIYEKDIASAVSEQLIVGTGKGGTIKKEDLSELISCVKKEYESEFKLLAECAVRLAEGVK
tara:strand:+ start:120 stop:362 length:243 start_codon:yes stop_codon:yes gene_type:complete